MPRFDFYQFKVFVHAMKLKFIRMLSTEQVICMRKILRQVVVVFRASLFTKELRMELQTKSDVEKMFLDAVKSVFPQKLITDSVKVECDHLIIGHKRFKLMRNVHLVGFGKAVLGMASAVEKLMRHHVKSGILCIPKGSLETFKDFPEFQLKQDTVIQVYEGASGNLPDENAEIGADLVVEKVKSLQKSDILVVLISGGGSALLPKPRKGLTLDEKLKVVKLLASCGASIKELNSVRKVLSEVKGGGLAIMSYPVPTISLILSDVIEDPLDVIASGPTFPNYDSPGTAFQILKKYNLVDLISPTVVKMTIDNDKSFQIPATAKGYTHINNFIIGNNLIAIREARNCAENLGFRTIFLTNVIDSAVHIICDFYVNLSFEICKALYSEDHDQFVVNINNLLQSCHYNFPTLRDDLLHCLRLEGYCKGICLIGGGETTVTIKGSGLGGRNQELALMVAQKLFHLKQVQHKCFEKFDILFLSAGTDGIDGCSPAAGAFGSADLIHKALENGIDPSLYLANNDSYNFFKIVNEGSHLITTGHTGTNVMDIHILVIRNLSVSKTS